MTLMLVHSSKGGRHDKESTDIKVCQYAAISLDTEYLTIYSLQVALLSVICLSQHPPPPQNTLSLMSTFTQLQVFLAVIMEEYCH
jgi:hypothetical protein